MSKAMEHPRRLELLMIAILALELFDVQGMDFMGPTVSSYGMMHIFLVVDYISK